jgi:hypothetical protein
VSRTLAFNRFVPPPKWLWHAANSVPVQCWARKSRQLTKNKSITSPISFAYPSLNLRGEEVKNRWKKKKIRSEALLAVTMTNATLRNVMFCILTDMPAFCRNVLPAGLLAAWLTIRPIIWEQATWCHVLKYSTLHLYQKNFGGVAFSAFYK